MLRCNWVQDLLNALRPISISIAKLHQGPMGEKQEVVVDVIKMSVSMTNNLKKVWVLTLCIFCMFAGWAQQTDTSYKRRVLETSEIDVLFSYYDQDGQHAAVTGGEGTEELTDATSTLVLRMPMNEDDILTVDVGLSAYTSTTTGKYHSFILANMA